MTRSIAHDHDAREERKATLYCLACDHASPVDGDWVRKPRGTEVAYVCPDCGTVITQRPRDSEGLSPGEAWGRVLRASVSMWQASIGIRPRVTATARNNRNER